VRAMIDPSFESSLCVLLHDYHALASSSLSAKPIFFVQMHALTCASKVQEFPKRTVSHRLSYSMYSANAHIDSTHPRRQRRRPTSMYWRSGTKALTTRATRRTSTRACRPKSMGRGGVHVPPSARAVPRNAHYQPPRAKCSHSLAIERQRVDEKLSNACLLAYCRASLVRSLD
jgi:hypothetical protein